MALIQPLQHLLALSVREWEAEGEVGGGPSRLQQPVGEAKDELVIYNLENSRRKEKGERSMLLVGEPSRQHFPDPKSGSTLVVGLSRTLSHRFLQGKVSTRGAMPWL